MDFFRKSKAYIDYHGFWGAIFNAAKLAGYLIRKHTRIKPFSTKIVNDMYKMHLDFKDEGITRALYLYGRRELDQVELAKKNLAEGMMVLDIGANMGYYVLLEAMMVGSSGKVYAYEPDPNNIHKLRKNLELNGFEDRVDVYQKGVSDRDGAMEFFISKRSNLHTFNPDSFKSGSGKAGFKESINVMVADIGKLMLDSGGVDFIRMDIEGHEVEVLGRISEVLGDLQRRPSILLETHFPKYDNKSHSMESALKAIFIKGYRVDAIVSDLEERNPLKATKYKPESEHKTDGIVRKIYRGIDKEDALNFICYKGGIRAVLLKPERL